MKKTFTLMRARQRDRRHLLRGAVAAAGAAVLVGLRPAVATTRPSSRR